MHNILSGLQLDEYLSIRKSSWIGRAYEDTALIIPQKMSINALPPANGQTVIQFPLSLPEEPSTFSFSIGLHEGMQRRGCCFKSVSTVKLTLKPSKIHLIGRTIVSLSLRLPVSPLLLELVTDPAQEGNEGADCDSAFWADLHITASPNPDANLDGRD